jgi:beta-mannosidase
VLLTAEVESDGVSLAVTNDMAAPWSGEVRWSLERLDGEVVATGRESVVARAVATTPAGTVPLGVSLADDADPEFRRGTVLVAELWGDGGMVTRTVTTFGPDKQLALRKAKLEIAVWNSAGSEPDSDRDGSARRAFVRLMSNTLLRGVELSVEGADVVFSDNYFDLPAGRRVEVSFDLPAGWSVGQTSVRVRSVVDTYA